jgi:hypothetical protein
MRSFVQHYFREWFSTDAKYSLAIARIAIHFSLLLLLCNNWTTPDRMLNGLADDYVPKGILAYISDLSPSAILIKGAMWLCLVSTCTALVGFMTRCSQVVSFVTALFLLTYMASFRAQGWHHGFNINLLAQMAFLPSRAGWALSVDAWRRKKTGKLRDPGTPGTKSDVFLVQVAAAIMFANAVYWKLVYSGFAWAFSDNFRAMLFMQYQVPGKPVPGYIEHILNNDVLYHSIAAGCLLGQCVPVLACIFITRPWLRGLSGVSFILLVLGFCLLMDLCNEHWYLLGVVFFDWDRIFRHIRNRNANRGQTGSTEATPTGRYFNPFKLAYGILFAGFFVYVAFNPVASFDHRFNTYPFSRFSMFSTMVISSPYDEHTPFAFDALRFEVVKATFSQERAREAEVALNAYWARRSTVGNPEERDILLARMYQAIRTTYPEIQEVNFFRISAELPAYPEKALPRVVQKNLVSTFRFTKDLTEESGIHVAPGN